MQIHVFACFLVRALPEVRDQIRKQFLIKCYIITVQTKILERFVPKNGVPKMDFPLYFQKVILVGERGGDSFFLVGGGSVINRADPV